MLTPAFELSQDLAFLTVVIKARYAKVPETEVFVDGTDFKFYSKPYFLRLNLPGRLVEDGREKASYDVDTGTFTIRIPKETPGEEFQGLDLLTKLLAPQGQTSAMEPSIEVLGDGERTEKRKGGPEEGGAEEEEGGAEEGEEEEFDWQVGQQPFLGEEGGDGELRGVTKYGFANRRSGVFKRLRDEICGIVDIQEADTVSLPERKRAKLMAENDKFDDSHYLADLYQDDAIRPLLQFTPPWVHNYKKMRERVVTSGGSSNPSSVPDVPFSADEKELMLKLPRKEFILSNVEEKGALLGVADILFAYAYNVRTVEGEKSVECAWTICKLSSTLSCLDWFGTPREMVIACCRRALCYPLFRNWDLCRKVLKDVRMMLRLGRNQVLKCLLEVHKLLSSDEPRYILNDLYISDYCVWLQSIGGHKLEELEQEIGQVQIEKKDVGLDLDDLEEAASQVKSEEDSSGMETADLPDRGGTGDHGNGHHHPPHPQQTFHQMGYPDLIQRSPPGPDIVTTHVVRSAGAENMEMHNGEGAEQQCDVDSDDDDDEDDEDDEDDDDEEEENEENATISKEEGSSGNREQGIDHERNVANRIDHSVNGVASTAQASLESDFVSKVTIATSDGNSEVADHSPSLIPSIPNCGSCVDRTDHKTVVDSETLMTESAGGDHDVEETMKDMLNQLSLDPVTPSVSDTGKPVDDTGAGSTVHFTEWMRSPPTKQVEMFGDNSTSQ